MQCHAVYERRKGKEDGLRGGIGHWTYRGSPPAGFWPAKNRPMQLLCWGFSS